MNHCVVYIHGKGGSADEARHYAPLFPGDTVIGFDYQAQTPWEAKAEFPQFVDPLCRKYDAVRLIANSIGAYFALHALSDRPIEKAFLISPVVDMEQLIRNMMAGAGVSEEELRRRGIEGEYLGAVATETVFTVGSEPLSVSYESVGDGDVIQCYMIIDIYNNSYWTESVAFTK